MGCWVLKIFKAEDNLGAKINCSIFHCSLFRRFSRNLKRGSGINTIIWPHIKGLLSLPSRLWFFFFSFFRRYLWPTHAPMAQLLVGLQTWGHRQRHSPRHCCLLCMRLKSWISLLWLPFAANAWLGTLQLYISSLYPAPSFLPASRLVYDHTLV